MDVRDGAMVLHAELYFLHFVQLETEWNGNLNFTYTLSCENNLKGGDFFCNHRILHAFVDTFSFSGRSAMSAGDRTINTGGARSVMVIVVGNGHEFKSWTRPVAFPIALIPLGKV